VKEKLHLLWQKLKPWLKNLWQSLVVSGLLKLLESLFEKFLQFAHKWLPLPKSWKHRLLLRWLKK
jgi:hypothetical protein